MQMNDISFPNNFHSCQVNVRNRKCIDAIMQLSQLTARVKVIWNA